MKAKSAPDPPCTVTAFWLKYRDSARCCRRVTQPPHIAGPLANIIIVSGEKYQKGKLVHYKQIGYDFKTHFTYEKIS
jgi:hypothetical protein